MTLLLTMLSLAPARAYDVLLEFKGAYFLPTNTLFRKIYNGSAIYGPELTAGCYKNLYGFVSVDYFSKQGRSIGLCSPTKMNMLNLGIGLKYLVPFCYGDFYVGLGALPTRLHVKDGSRYVIPCRTKWGCGGVAKVGAYFDLPKSFFVDLFFDYSFATIPFPCCPTAPVQSYNAKLNGCWFGVGLGYRFH